ncbi:abortive infection family protein [Aquisalinus flavus]|uniref:Abortive infection protein-like C-terminal domain-containing protein n=1 Tax=Aquisalinus flavus TaxID=1526572 RepID=A0A8J2V4L3_9PROT|nr:abortive infection family protein [Aquisalinus flavus]MBD0426166.1 abortive infection family protein [Aquisalinus flavus]UNE48257.1 abortive phage resistance protein [Aquisalinus flavus]GGD10049.1 hypothetical protein GCM10011342_18720 [Aquisalinus flavus]
MDAFFDSLENRYSVDLPTDKLERAMFLRNGLVALCEGSGKMNNQHYSLLRREFMADASLVSLLPQFVRASQDTDSVWSFLKDYNPQWEPRRKFVRSEFHNLIDALERKKPFAEEVITDTLSAYSAEEVKAAWGKALERRDTDPSGAVTSARALLESVCKHILEDESGKLGYSPNDDLPKLYKLASERLNIAPSQHTEDAFKRILGGAASIVESLSTLRNRMGDAHGQGRKPVRPAPRHAALAVNMAGSMALFLIETAASQTTND